MRIIRGIAASKGVAFGPAFLLGTEDIRIPQKFVSDDLVKDEIERFRRALDAVSEDLAENERLASSQLGEQYGAIFGAHLQLARDPKLRTEIEGLITHQLCSPEYATSKILRHYAQKFQRLGDKYLAERAVDLFDLEKRVLQQLMGSNREELSHLTQPVILLAGNLTPGETANLDRSLILGFATEEGGRTSHTAILAGALGLPAVVGLGPFLSEVSGGESIILDGNHGELIIDPDQSTLDEYHSSAKRQQSFALKLEALRTVPGATRATEERAALPIRLMGNIEFPDEVDLCVKQGAQGVGLYRTEFLYLGRHDEPTEEDHYQAYRQVLEPYDQEPVVIRTLDLGADKLPKIFGADRKISNPFLGLRSLRLCLQNLPLFKRQLRALLRAAVYGDLWIMFPLVTTLLELRQAKMILSDVMDDLEEEGVHFKRNVPVGMMVEVPSAALLAREFAAEVDFFSIGTNDLVQYTLAVDRANQAVANLYSSGDPAILRLLKLVVEAAVERGISVTVCGQMSSDPIYVPLLVGLGLRRLSINPGSILEIKEVLRLTTLEKAEEIARHALTLDVARDVESYLRGELKKICPELLM